jgi:hypothetical protein
LTPENGGPYGRAPNVEAEVMLMDALPLVLALVSAPAPVANPELSAEEFRIFCGWQEEMQKPENAPPVTEKHYARVAKLAKVNPKELKKTVAKAEGVGPTCEAIAKTYEDKARKALADTPLDARILSFSLDLDDPTHVVAYVSWKGEKEKLLEEEASLVAWAVSHHAPIVRTLSTSAKDSKDPENAPALFEGKISTEQAKKIDRARIDSFADARYIKLFDGVVFANPAAHPSALK